MKMKLLVNILLFAGLAACSRVAPAPSAASCNVASCVRQVDAWGANSLRVRVVMPGHQMTQPAAQGLLPEPPARAMPLMSAVCSRFSQFSAAQRGQSWW